MPERPHTQVLFWIAKKYRKALFFVAWRRVNNCTTEFLRFSLKKKIAEDFPCSGWSRWKRICGRRERLYFVGAFCFCSVWWKWCTSCVLQSTVCGFIGKPLQQSIPTSVVLRLHMYIYHCLHLCACAYFVALPSACISFSCQKRTCVYISWLHRASVMSYTLFSN